ncbi:hypothetical protein SAMN04489761_3167 [Tenacibaculum sp. MAR_2009_124]|uniref:hypothetical protein n=1 Tax=Tenacibaculum sp. MAR_2009_124 TaxID=1250059 RepID=UPI000898842E|nr:hypothetical protein [Tenacibaculum sp. MAR_2009_124]SEC50173.1 hypothetical protein SAMN04489761_3167 [Tenacibaculum sp. MAR_2009_124]
MMNKIFCVFCFFVIVYGHAQTKQEEFRSKKIRVLKNIIQIDSLSIYPEDFKVLTAKEKKVIPQSEYQIDFGLSQLSIDKEKYPEIIVQYYLYPDFLTKTYVPFDKRLIVENTKNMGRLYSETTNKKTKDVKLFDGLETQGFITRGLTSGNNQNAVTNSTLDLTISGKLSKKVGIRANIFDTNFPLQQSGYSQNVTDFDRIFVELYSKHWNLKGGDISLSNRNSYFLNFDKQVSGVEVGAKFNEGLSAGASGAIVRGKFSVFNFVGAEGNQGPYKILGSNNESAIIMIEGSERVFVNGIAIERGENKDYIIDYNLAEIRFNTTYPITNDMRIRIEFQYSDRNYTRFITYGKSEYKSDSFAIAGFFYNENDAKNQPVQQSLTDAQKQILANAGNDPSKMTAPSAFADQFSANRIQYKKTIVGVEEVFEYTTNESDEVYTVTFTNVGQNRGNYEVDKTIAIGTIYKYAGINSGSFSPIIQLIAPTKLQVAVVNSMYKPSEKTELSTELAFSDNDQNLFSEIDNRENQKVAAKVGWKQQISNKTWDVSSSLDYKFIQNNFQTVQRFQSVEFNRDWNLENRAGDQNELGVKLFFDNKKHTKFSYEFQHLSFSNNFSGNKHAIQANIKKEKTSFWLQGSWLDNFTNSRNDNFYRIKSKAMRSFNKSWIGAAVNLESNSRKLTATNNFDALSHSFNEVEGFYGVGDSTKVYVKVGVNYRTNDSIKSNAFTQVNNRKTFYINSRLIQNKTTNLTVFANYRSTNNTFKENEEALNSRIAYNQRFFKSFLTLGTSYETTSGNIARQDFVYVKTEPGQGYYTWIDYNNDGEQQFNEFEVAQFQDQATYLRVALPNIRFVPTQRVKWKQSVTLNPQIWKAKKGLIKLLSHFYNQTYVTIDNERLKEEGGFHWNPFQMDGEELLGLTFNIRNNFYFNRSLQKYSWTYSYGKSRNKQQFSIGTQENNSLIHQLEFQHKLTKFWLFEAKGALSENQLQTENLANRNYNIQIKEVQPKLTFLYNKDHKFSFFYHLKDKENIEKDFEKLQLQKLGLSYFFLSPKKNQLTADVTMFINNFSGNENSPVGYQMLEGLQVGRNYTWSLLWNQKLTSILNLSLNYFGRKSEGSTTIHSGTVQLKAIF